MMDNSDGGMELVVSNKYASEEDSVENDDSQKQLTTLIEPSYEAKQNIKSVLLLSSQDATNDVNSQYIRSRRYGILALHSRYIYHSFLGNKRAQFCEQKNPNRRLHLFLDLFPSDLIFWSFWFVSINFPFVLINKMDAVGR